MQKTGTKLPVAGFPANYEVRQHTHRKQPYTLWIGDSVVYFADSTMKIMAYALEEQAGLHTYAEDE